MSRRADLTAGHGYLTNPTPSSVGPADESAVARFVRTEVLAHDKLPGNISIVTSLAMFIGGITAVRLWGDLMLPP